MSDDERLFIVTAKISGESYPESYHVSAPDAEAAEEKVRRDAAVEHVYDEMTEQFSGCFRLSISGSPEEITTAIAQFEEMCGVVDADAEIEDVTPTVWPSGEDMDDEHALRVRVGSWDDMEMRIIGNDVYDDEQVLCATPASLQARDGSTVEVVAGDKTIVRAGLKDSPEPPEPTEANSDADM